MSNNRPPCDSSRAGQYHDGCNICVEIPYTEPGSSEPKYAYRWVDYNSFYPCKQCTFALGMRAITDRYDGCTLCRAERHPHSPAGSFDLTVRQLFPEDPEAFGDSGYYSPKCCMECTVGLYGQAVWTNPCDNIPDSRCGDSCDCENTSTLCIDGDGDEIEYIPTCESCIKITNPMRNYYVYIRNNCVEDGYGDPKANLSCEAELTKEHGKPELTGTCECVLLPLDCPSDKPHIVTGPGTDPTGQYYAGGCWCDCLLTKQNPDYTSGSPCIGQPHLTFDGNTCACVCAKVPFGTFPVFPYVACSQSLPEVNSTTCACECNVTKDDCYIWEVFDALTCSCVDESGYGLTLSTSNIVP